MRLLGRIPLQRTLGNLLLPLAVLCSSAPVEASRGGQDEPGQRDATTQPASAPAQPGAATQPASAPARPAARPAPAPVPQYVPPQEDSPATAGAKTPAKTSAKDRSFFLGVGFSLGFFYPKGVRDHIEAWKNSLPGISATVSGTSAMIVNLVPRVAISYKPIEYLRIHITGEIGWGPKIITGRDESELFSFFRFSPGAALTAHLPLGKSQLSSIFVGGGVAYHAMLFEGISAGAVGGRAMAGYSIHQGIMSIDATIAFDYASAATGEPIGFGETRELILDYTGVMVGATVHFGLF